MFSWLRRRGENRSAPHDQVIAETRDLAEAVLRTAETIRQEREQDRQALASLVESLKPKNETPRRFFGLLVATAICAAVVIVAVQLAPAAFAAPPPNYADAGVVGLYVWSNPLNGAQASALRDPGVSLSVVADQRSSRVKYVATFPKKLVGDRFVVGVSGSAVLDNFESSGLGVSNEYPACQVMRQDGKSLAAASCQLITGIVPSASSGSLTGCRSKNDEETVAIQFSGTAHVNSTFDWAHHITSLPYAGNTRGAGFGNVDDIVVGSFGQNFPEATLTTCYQVGLNPAWTDYTPNFAATIHIGDTMAWDPASNAAGYVIVSTERSAQWKGNALYAALGVFGSAFLSLLVTTIRSGHRLRSQSKRRGSS